MSPRTGRPTNDPKDEQYRIRLSKADAEKLEYCHQRTGKTKADIIREGIYIIYNRLKEQEADTKKD